MIESIEIENLRGIAHGKLDGLTPLTILVGPNGSGKSTILDALLLGANTETQTTTKYVLERRTGDHDQHKWLIRRNISNSATIQVFSHHWHNRVFISYNKETKQVEFSFGHKNENPTTTEAVLMLTEENTPGAILIDHREKNLQTQLYKIYSQVVEKGGRDSLNPILENIIPNFSNIEILTENSTQGIQVVTPVLNVVFKGTRGSVPVSLAGDGIHALIRMAMEIQLSGGLALIEEPEAHQHPATIRQVAKAIYASVRKNNQVVLTTHSIELIDALLDAASEPGDLDKMSVFWVTLNDGELKSVRIPGEDVAFERENLGKDLR